MMRITPTPTSRGNGSRVLVTGAAGWTAVAILKFENGALGTITATTAAYPGLTARIAVHGDRGSAVIDDDELVYFHAAGVEQVG